MNGMPDPLVYSAEVARRFEAPPRQGAVFGPPTELRTGSAGDTRLGARVSFEARVRQGRVAECRFRAYGCPHVIAAASWVAEHAEGRPVADGDWPDAHELARRLEVPAHKLGSLLVVEDAYRAMLADAGSRPGT